MLSKVCSAAVNVKGAHPVEVEVNEGYRETVIVAVALPDAAVKEFLHVSGRTPETT